MTPDEFKQHQLHNPLIFNRAVLQEQLVRKSRAGHLPSHDVKATAYRKLWPIGNNLPQWL